MKKRTIYLPDWLDEEIERKAGRQMRSFSAQVVYVLSERFRYADSTRIMDNPYLIDGGVSILPFETTVWYPVGGGRYERMPSGQAAYDPDTGKDDPQVQIGGGDSWLL